MFTEKEKRIFKFTVAGKSYARDPVRLVRRFQASQPANYDKLVEDVTGGDPAKISAAADVLVPRIAAVLGLKLLSDTAEGDQDGAVNEDEVWNVYNAFWDWVEKKSDDTAPSPSNSPTTQASTPSPADASPTPTTSDCGCTGTPN